MKITINICFCVKNLAKGSEIVKQELLRDPDFNVSEYGCTSYCGICRNYYVAIVNGKPIKADSPNELLDNIHTYVEDVLLEEM